MTRLNTTVALVCGTFMAGASEACVFDRDPTRTVVLVNSTLELCDDIITTVDELVDDLLVTTHLKEESTTLDYWSNWMLKNVDDPILTQRVEESFFGLGVFRPYEMTSNDDELSYEEWIKTYGVQLSVGIGEKDKPRVRLDYQWHDQFEDVFHVQFEVPF
ncbi:hypothetical protein [Vibrio ezurae]|uniref:Uncharacterized protein n=1 Tax=Vibrio ezurae NBRC 102218 TaxID=1219080 RepID=U3CNW1_9VIBR|nr:hypothetical protein [Vibrio ezurae]GAD79808.1 hypothetical protein VEZ01S_20_00800 [Vibrio ezurae NBRC 102218]